MPESFRQFEVHDPFGQTWQVDFLWLQNAISIRHSDSVDVKFRLVSGDCPTEKVVALMHPWLLALSHKTARPITDAWCARLAARHLEHMVTSWQDMEKSIVTPGLEDLERHQGELERLAPAAR